jgi:hypothetical protein
MDSHFARASRALGKSLQHSRYLLAHPEVLKPLSTEELCRGFRASQKLEKAVADLRTDLRASGLRSDVVTKLVKAVAGFCAVPRRGK